MQPSDIEAAAQQLRASLAPTDTMLATILDGHLQMLEMLALPQNWRREADHITGELRPAARSIITAARVAAPYKQDGLLVPIENFVNRDAAAFNDDPRTTHDDIVRAIACVICANPAWHRLRSQPAAKQVATLTAAPETQGKGELEKQGRE